MLQKKSELKKFKDILVGDKFIHNNLVWVKIERYTESCCSGNYNAHVVGDLSETRNFEPVKKVKVIDGN